MQIQSTERPSVLPRPSAEPRFADGPIGSLILDRYRLLARLAVGGTAEVWRANDELLDRPVAVKLLHAHLVTDERARERLAAEARAVGALAHPGIARIYDLDLGSERPALVLELIEGHSLAARLDDGALPTGRAATIVAEIAAALAHAHEHGVVHRDVKPGNILIDAWGHAHLVDFGIAQALVAAGEHLTSTGTIAGTLPYMAPEQLSDAAIGPWTDLYALGVVLYQAVTGELPYASTAPVALARQQLIGPPAMRGVSPALAGVVRSCLAPRPADRPRSAALVAAALRAWLAGDPAPGRALAPFPAGNLVRLTTAARQWTGAPRHRRSVAAALAASAAAGILAFTIATGGSAPVALPDGAMLDGGVLHVEGAVIPAPGLGTVVVGNAGGGVVVPPDSPVGADPPWMATMVAEYRDGCGSAADPLELIGLTRTEAVDLVASRVDACAVPDATATPEPARRHGSKRDVARDHDKVSGDGASKHHGKGHGAGKGHRDQGDAHGEQG
jgi:serine/threonine-protein kinase